VAQTHLWRVRRAAHSRKTKLKTIAATFVATTVFWCFAILGVFWWLSHENGDDFIEDAQKRGFYEMMMARNTESQPVTFTVAELPTNTASADTPQLVLLERQVPPAGELWIGIKKTKVAGK